jgi:aspartate aminotransferase
MCKAIAPSVTLSIDAKAKDMKQQGLDVVGFGAGEPDFPTPPHICDAAREAITLGLTRYTPSEGTLALRKAICQKLQRDNGLTYTPGEIIVSNGAKHTLFTIFQAILDDGDEVLIPTPCWVSYPEIVRMAGGVPVFVPTTEEDDFVPSGAAIAEKITARTKAIVITSPSNPNGSVWSAEALESAAYLAKEHDFFIVSDEIYENLLYDGRKHISIASLSEDAKARTFLVNGLSKSYAMTGWRIGYCAGPLDVIRAMGNFQSQATSNPNSIAQHAGVTALTASQKCVAEMAAEFERRRNFMVEHIGCIPGLTCKKPAGAFYVMMNMKALIGHRYQGRVINGSMDFADLLLTQEQVAVVPGVAFEAEGYCRLSYAVSLDDIKKGLDRIEHFVSLLEPPV